MEMDLQNVKKFKKYWEDNSKNNLEMIYGCKLYRKQMPMGMERFHFKNLPL